VARLPSFFLPPGDWREPYVLAEAEAHHLARVLRLREGDRVRLFDGAGREGVFTIEEVTRKRVVLSEVSVDSHAPPGSRLVLALGWTKAGRRDWILEKAVELGAAGVVFWQAQRSQGRIPDEVKPSWRDKLVQAAKQCANPWLPSLSVAGGLDALLESGADTARRFVLSLADDAPMADPRDFAAPGTALVVVGPEGGMTPDEETTLARAGFAPICLGHGVLRFETAALAAMALAFWARTATNFGMIDAGKDTPGGTHPPHVA
jgi:16S rRNA (uracil1498-N3)-methyltransferase